MEMAAIIVTPNNLTGRFALLPNRCPFYYMHAGIAHHEDPFRSLGPSINLGSMGRHKEVRRDPMPGPGAYVVDRTSRGLGYASHKGARIVGRPTERKVLRSEQTPGPGENYVTPINRIKGGATMKLPTGTASHNLRMACSVNSSHSDSPM